jgi:hypothetical protein
MTISNLSTFSFLFWIAGMAAGYYLTRFLMRNQPYNISNVGQRLFLGMAASAVPIIWAIVGALWGWPWLLVAGMVLGGATLGAGIILSTKRVFYNRSASMQSELPPEYKRSPECEELRRRALAL